MKYSYEISHLALVDLDNIWEYTVEQWSIEQANKYYSEIILIISKICNKPELGKPLFDVKQDHRRMNVKSHMIIYKLEKDKIYIDRILHQSMDINKHMNE